MIRPRPSKDSLHLFALVAAVVTIAALYFARIILIPLALALLFTFILTPLVKALERAHFGRIPSTLLVVALSVVVFGAVGWSVAMQFSEVVNQLPQYKSSIRTKLQSLHLASNHTLDNASQTMTDLSRDLASSPTPSRGGEAEFPATKARPSEQARPTRVEVVKSPALPLESLESVLVLLGSALIVVVFTIFMLIRREDLRDRLILLAGEERLHTITQALDDASARVSRYLLLETLVNAVYGIFIGVCLHFIGVPGAPLWGAIAGLLRFLPYLGPPLGALMPLLLSLAVFSSWKGPLLTFSLFVITEIVVSNLLEPVLYGAHTGLSSLAILVAAIFWTSLSGSRRTDSLDSIDGLPGGPWAIFSATHVSPRFVGRPTRAESRLSLLPTAASHGLRRRTASAGKVSGGKLVAGSLRFCVHTRAWPGGAGPSSKSFG